VRTLYVVATPIGNLEDITLRALRVLREAKLIAAEDTRTTRKLVDRYEIATPLISYHEHNKLTRLDLILDSLESGDVALVSDAGTPGISDPGYELIAEVIARGMRVVPVPGPSAVTAALIGSGLPTDSYVYLGFLPRKSAALREALAGLSGEQRTLVAFESPNRLVETLTAILGVIGDRPIAVARELTKLHEEFIRCPVSTVLAHFTALEPRGEITLIIGGAPKEETPAWDAARVRAALRARLEAGETRSAAVKVVARESGWERRAVYDLSLSL
jgi:16S rRNA (cytidine1402-2'-O)-methyltransferase